MVDPFLLTAEAPPYVRQEVHALAFGLGGGLRHDGAPAKVPAVKALGREALVVEVPLDVPDLKPHQVHRIDELLGGAVEVPNPLAEVVVVTQTNARGILRASHQLQRSTSLSNQSRST